MATLLTNVEHIDIDPAALRGMRESRGYTLEMVGKAVGKPRQNIFAYEKGIRRPPAYILARLCALYECSLSDFYKKIS